MLEAQLNYPSFSTFLGSTNQTYSRTVTTVGEAISTYSVEIDPPPGIDLSVEPSRLQFSELNQKMTYSVTFSRSTTAKYSARSPIVVFIE